MQSDRLFTDDGIYTTMTHNSKVNHTHLDTEAVKDLELDESPRPTRKQENPAIPSGDSTPGFSHKRVKGTTKAR